MTCIILRYARSWTYTKDMSSASWHRQEKRACGQI